MVASILWQTFDRRFALITNLASVDPGRPIPDRPGWPTFQHKKKFYDLCTKLSLADLNQMVSLVQRTCVSAVQNCGDKEVEVTPHRECLSSKASGPSVTHGVWVL